MSDKEAGAGGVPPAGRLDATYALLARLEADAHSENWVSLHGPTFLALSKVVQALGRWDLPDGPRYVLAIREVDEALTELEAAAKADLSG